MKLNTHLCLDTKLCGRVIELSTDHSTVELLLTEEMKADASGLVHGGFIFGAADYAAMAAVNDPNVVLGSAQVKFMKASRVKDVLRLHAVVNASEGKKRTVSVIGTNAVDGAKTFEGSFVCFVLDTHVLQPVS